MLHTGLHGFSETAKKPGFFVLTTVYAISRNVPLKIPSATGLAMATIVLTTGARPLQLEAASGRRHGAASQP
jgi:hypothetical protein